MTQATMYARLTKVDEAKRQVTGVIASETPDRAREIFDYDSSKPNFESWSNTMAKASGGKSVGNVRAMHGNVAVGGLEELKFDDLNKSIEVTANIVDDNEWNKVLKGVYTGFSIGGAYDGPKWDDPVRKGYKRYKAKPSEVSLVDLPCNPEASFVMVKADGMEENVPFHHPDEAELLAKLADTTLTGAEKADYAQRLAKLYDPDSNPVNQEDEELAKGAYSIGELANLADRVACFLNYSCCSWDENGVQVMKPFAPEVRDAATKLYDALLKLVAEDVEAAKAKLKGIKKMADDEDGALRKVADMAIKDFGVSPNVVVIEDLGKFMASPEHAEALMKASQNASTEHLTLSKVFGISAFGINEGALLDDAVESINKFVGAHDELQKSHDALKVELEDLKKRAEPAKGSVKPVPVAKTDDNGAPLEKGAAATEEKKEETDPLVLMKAAQSRPIPIGMGSPLTKPA